MRVTKHHFLIAVGLLLTIGLTGVFALGGKGDSKKIPKNHGALTVKTSPDPLTVKVDGQVLGMSGVREAAEFYLAPGTYRLEVETLTGKSYTSDITIRKNERNCICLSVEKKTVPKACPYNVTLDGPDKVLEGDLITFASIDAEGSDTPLNYVWKITPSQARITSGNGTNAITVSTAGLRGQTITAELDVSDGLYARFCRQILSVSTKIWFIEKEPDPEPEPPIWYDKCGYKAFDDCKARLDNYVIELQTNPDYQAYIMMFQGTDRGSVRSGEVDKLSKRIMDYLVNWKGVDPQRIVITRWGNRPTTEFELWAIPPGASTPVPKGY